MTVLLGLRLISDSATGESLAVKCSHRLHVIQNVRQLTRQILRLAFSDIYRAINSSSTIMNDVVGETI